jgi:3,4-dihydroxy 2-butanone 4-phosphate synthase
MSKADVLYPSSNDPKDAGERMRVALDALRAGMPVLVQDDVDRENEADLIVAAQKIGVASMAMMIRHGSGIVCLCLPGETIDRLALPQMVNDNTSRQGTAFTVTIEAKTGVTTGVSAKDRVRTIQAAIDPNAGPDTLARPGHVFPLRARAGGVLERRGHTEAAVELARLAGLLPAGVLCELMNDDGTMAHGHQVKDFARTHGLVILTIQDIVDYRLAVESPEIGERRSA